MFTDNIFVNIIEGMQCCRLPNVMVFFPRTSDGGKTVGTIEVNLVKMGELEDGETDHVTTDSQDQKVKTSVPCTKLIRIIICTRCLNYYF